MASGVKSDVGQNDGHDIFSGRQFMFHAVLHQRPWSYVVAAYTQTHAHAGMQTSHLQVPTYVDIQNSYRHRHK